MGEPISEQLFKEVAELFLKEYQIITDGQRSPKYVANMKRQLDNYILPFMGERGISQVTSGLVQEYRLHRHEHQINHPTKNKHRGTRPPSRTTLHQEVVVIRQVLKTAIRHGWLKHLPDLFMPYKTAGKVQRRAWFGPEEYKKLYEATRRRAQRPKKERYRWDGEQLHDYVLFMANTGLRPDEANRLEYRDVQIVRDQDTSETILEIDVRGKRGTGYCKSTSGAVRPFERLRDRNAPDPMDKVFPSEPNLKLLLSDFIGL